MHEPQPFSLMAESWFVRCNGSGRTIQVQHLLGGPVFLTSSNLSSSSWIWRENVSFTYAPFEIGTSTYWNIILSNFHRPIFIKKLCFEQFIRTQIILICTVCKWQPLSAFWHSIVSELALSSLWKFLCSFFNKMNSLCTDKAVAIRLFGLPHCAIPFLHRSQLRLIATVVNSTCWEIMIPPL
jgi:hypothetical protein